jgi:hypothetical protein
MERFEEAAIKARRHIVVADHMMSVTYPVVKEPKLLLAVIENIFLAQSNAIDALLHHERAYKRVPPFSEAFESKLHLLKFKCADEYGITTDHIRLFETIHALILKHKESPFEFSRDGKFIICSDEYQLDAISEQHIKDYIRSTKEMVKHFLSFVEVPQHV